MDYETFDIGKIEDKLSTKITQALLKRPKTANDLAKELNEYTLDISIKLQKLKNKGIISNIKDEYNTCYWGLLYKFRNKIEQSERGEK